MIDRLAIEIEQVHIQYVADANRNMVHPLGFFGYLADAIRNKVLTGVRSDD